MNTDEPFGFHPDMALALIDIDHFKQINDTTVMMQVIECCRLWSKFFRKAFARLMCLHAFGGDEFVLLLPGANSEKAYDVVERARVVLADQPIYFSDQVVLINISGGIASVAGDDDTFEQLMPRADQAMYQSKEAGRNRVITEK